MLGVYWALMLKACVHCVFVTSCGLLDSMRRIVAFHWWTLPFMDARNPWVEPTELADREGNNVMKLAGKAYGDSRCSMTHKLSSRNFWR